MKTKGEITIFLSLSLTIIISLLLAVIQSTTDKAMRMRVENAMDMGMQSIFAEYNKELLSKYDLYFIDSSYGLPKGNAYYTGEHLKNYIEYNLNPNKGQIVLFKKDLFGLSATNVDILLFSLATDDNASVYKRQAIQAVKDRFGAAIIENFKKSKTDYENSGITTFNVTEKREATRKKMKEKADKATDAEGNKISFDDPTKKIEQYRSGIINLILDSNSISKCTTSNFSLPSDRNLYSGDGIIECHEDLNSVTNNLLFSEYISWKFGCYTNQLSHSQIKYEQEYILKNKSTDFENLNAIVKDLLLIRETANVIYLFKDSTKREEAKAIATVIAALLLMPEIADVIADAILFSWGFAESCVDVKTLLNGGKVPIMKDQNSWVLSLTNALNFKAHLNDGMAKSSGIDYKTYLKIFLALENSSNKIWRSITLIENNIKNTAKNSNFKIDNCIEYLDAEVTVAGKNNFKVSIRRYFGYIAMPLISY